MKEIPILLLVFNRLEPTKRVFEAIKKEEPKKLYIVSDGPRTQKEEIIVNKIRNYLIESVTWDCEVKTLFRDTNLGCKYSVYDGINWFFKKEEKGIILEDDCLPKESFFRFMKYCLNKYEKIEEIGMIAGHLAITGFSKETSYIYSRYKGCWGWATWRDRWNRMDIKICNRETKETLEAVKFMTPGKIGRYSWKIKIRSVKAEKISAWDWPWYLSLNKEKLLCIFPTSNLIENIGFGEGATHTKYIPEKVRKHETLLEPIKAPNNIEVNKNFEKIFEKHYYKNISLIKYFILIKFSLIFKISNNKKWWWL